MTPTPTQTHSRLLLALHHLNRGEPNAAHEILKEETDFESDGGFLAHRVRNYIEHCAIEEARELIVNHYRDEHAAEFLRMV